MHLEEGSDMDSRADSFASEVGNVHNSQELRQLEWFYQISNSKFITIPFKLQGFR